MPTTIYLEEELTKNIEFPMNGKFTEVVDGKYKVCGDDHIIEPIRNREDSIPVVKVYLESEAFKQFKQEATKVLECKLCNDLPTGWMLDHDASMSCWRSTLCGC